MPPELVILLGTLALALLVAVPAIRRNLVVPPQMQLATCADEQLEDRQRAYFQRLDGRLRPLGYAPLLTITATNLGSPNLQRLYRSDHDPAVLTATCLRTTSSTVLGKAEGVQNPLEWETKLADGTVVQTGNTQLTPVFEPLPHQVQQHLPGIADVAQLKARHDRKVEELRHREPRFQHGEDPLVEIAAFHRRWIDFHRARGALRLDEAAGVYRPTTKLALRGVANYFNPFRDNFSAARLVLGLLAGGGLPLAAQLAVRHADAFGPLAPWLQAGAPAALALPVIGFLAAGAAVGWLFGPKSFIWALLLGFLATRLAGGTPGYFLPLCMGAVAEQLGSWRTKRSALV